MNLVQIITVTEIMRRMHVMRLGISAWV